MSAIEQRIVELDQEIRRFTVLLPRFANDDARHWIAARLRNCVEEYIQLVEQHYAARIAEKECERGMG